MRQHFEWSERYRPSTIDECVLPDRLKNTFNNFIAQGEIPNLLLLGPHGIGKTTTAKAMLESLKKNYLTIPASLKGDMDTLRNEIMGFASTVSFLPGRKYVILDEADFLGWKTQPALRNFMQDFSKNCGFILTANYKNKIMPELRSRCAEVDFTLTKKEGVGLAKQFLDRLTNILDQEKVTYDKKALVEIIIKYFPDWRRILNESQYLAAQCQGKIDSTSLVILKNWNIESLIKDMKTRNFPAIRKWASGNVSNDAQAIFREFYDQSSTYFDESFIPSLVLIVNKYQELSLRVIDPEINLASFLVEVMIDAVWKQ